MCELLLGYFPVIIYTPAGGGFEIKFGFAAAERLFHCLLLPLPPAMIRLRMHHHKVQSRN
jgi:hypothetical protein